MHVNMLKVKKLRTPTRPFPEGWRGNEREQSNCALEIEERKIDRGPKKVAKNPRSLLACHFKESGEKSVPSLCDSAGN